MTISATEADDILRRDLGRYEAALQTLVKDPLTENHFGALVSLTCNLGSGNLKSSTLLRKLNAGDHVEASGEFGR